MGTGVIACSGGKVSRAGFITMNKSIIAELEANAKVYKRKFRPWTKDEDEIVARFYSKVERDLLLKALPGRTHSAIKCRASQLGRK